MRISAMEGAKGQYIGGQSRKRSIAISEQPQL